MGLANFNAGNGARSCRAHHHRNGLGWESPVGVSVTDAGLVTGFVVKVHVASEGRTGHENPLTTSGPVRFTPVTVSVKDCELPCDTVTVGLDAEM